jgi:hypothetical protein
MAKGQPPRSAGEPVATRGAGLTACRLLAPARALLRGLTRIRRVATLGAMERRPRTRVRAAEQPVPLLALGLALLVLVVIVVLIVPR